LSNIFLKLTVKRYHL